MKTKVDMHEFPVVTLIGSTRFKEDFERIGCLLSLQGFVVLMPGIWEKTYGITVTPEQEEMLENMGGWRIEHSSLVLVVNPKGYVGLNTLREIEYCISNNKPLAFTDVPLHETIDAMLRAFGKPDKKISLKPVPGIEFNNGNDGPKRLGLDVHFLGVE